MKKRHNPSKSMENAIKAEHLFSAAKRSINIGDMDVALSLLDQTLAIKADYYGALLLKGATLTTLNRYDEACVCYRKVLEHDPSYLKAELGLAFIDFLREDYDKFILFVEKYLETHKSDDNFWYCYANALSNTGDKDRALEVITKTIRISPKKLSYNLYYFRLLFELGLADRALNEMGLFLKRNPRNLELLEIKADCLAYREDIEEALSTWDYIISIDTTFFRGIIGKTRVLYRNDRLNEAEAILDTISPEKRLERNDAYILADLWIRMSKNDKALKVLNKALIDSPDDPLLLSAIGLAKEEAGDNVSSIETFDSDPLVEELQPLLKSGRIKEAEDCICNYQALIVEPALIDSPDDPLLLSAIGLAKEEVGDNVSSIETFDSDHLMEKLQTLLKSGRIKEAEDCICKCQALIDEPALILYLAQASADEEENEMARLLADNYLKFEPDDPTGWGLIGDMNQRLKDYTKAEEAYNCALAIEPDNFEILTRYLYLLADMKAYDEAIKICDQKLTISSDPDKILKKKGWILGLMDRFEEALEIFLPLTQKYPDNSYAWWDLGWTYFGLDKSEEAILAYERSLSINPDEGNVWYNIAVQYASIDRTREAKDAYQKAIRNIPDNSDAWLGLAEILWTEGEYESSNSAYKRYLKLEPGDTEAFVAYGDNCYELGQYNEALEAAETALNLDPHMREAKRLKVKVKSRLKQG